MERIQIDTTRNVSLEYEIAGIPDRIGATLLDWLILLGYILIVYSVFLGWGIKLVFEHTQSLWIFWIISTLPVTLYSLLCETLMNGQSFGKKVTKIKVMRTDGSQPTLGNYLLRWLLRIIDVDLFYGVVAIITIAINGKGQRLGDMAAGTMVVKLKPRASLNESAFIQLDETYIPVFPQAIQLTDKEATLIKSALLLTEEENEDLVQAKLAERLKEYLKIETHFDNRKLLTTLLRDYNKINGNAKEI